MNKVPVAIKEPINRSVLEPMLRLVFERFISLSLASTNMGCIDWIKETELRAATSNSPHGRSTNFAESAASDDPPAQTV